MNTKYDAKNFLASSSRYTLALLEAEEEESATTLKSEDFKRAIGFTAAPFATETATSSKVVVDELTMAENSTPAESNIHLEEKTQTPPLDEYSSELREKLSSFESLSSGWNGYDAEAPDKLAINTGEMVLDEFIVNNLIPTDVTPSVEGGIGMYFRIGRKYADIECLNSGEILAITSEDDRPPVVWEIELGNDVVEHSSIQEAIKDIRVFLRD